MSFTIRRATERDWRRYRDIRLRMLADTPMAYNDTLAESERFDEATWRQRVARTERPGNILVVAESGDEWLGTMGGYTSPGRGVLLVGVFVDPRWRGRHAGVADALLEAIIDWAAREDDALLLDVHEQNEPAIRFYRRHGFDPTGRFTPYDLPPFGNEIEMRRAAGNGAAGE